jgi:hypothetical protein
MSEYQSQSYDTPQDNTPPQGSSYNASQQTFSGPPPQTPSTNEPLMRPLPLEEAVRQLPQQYLRVLTHPGAAVFAQEQGKAAWNIVWVQIALTSVAAILVGMVGFDAHLFGSLATISVFDQILQQIKDFSLLYTLRYVLLTPILFFVGMGLYQLFAKMWGGKGKFLVYCYCTLLFAVPISILTSLFSAVTVLGGVPAAIGSVVVGGLSIYGILERIFATMAVHRLSGGKATWVVLIFPILLFVALLIVISVVAGVVALFLYHPSSPLH